MWSRWSPHLSYELLLLLIFSFPCPHYLPSFTGIPCPLIYFHTCFSSQLDSSFLESRGDPILIPHRPLHSAAPSAEGQEMLIYY